MAKRADPAAVSPRPAETVQVVFRCDHEHAGTSYRAGDVLVVTPRERDLLRHFNVIEPENA